MVVEPEAISGFADIKTTHQPNLSTPFLHVISSIKRKKSDAPINDYSRDRL
jgi:hypothetical protein